MVKKANKTTKRSSNINVINARTITTEYGIRESALLSNDDALLFLNNKLEEIRSKGKTRIKRNINQIMNSFYLKSGMNYLIHQTKKSEKKVRMPSNVNLELLHELIKKSGSNYPSLDTITKAHNERTENKTISRSSVYTALKLLGYKYLNLSKLNNKAFLASAKIKQIRFIKYICYLWRRGDILLFVDESPLEKNINKSKGWIKKEGLLTTKSATQRLKHLNLLHIFSTLNQSNYKITINNTNSYIFWNFVQNSIMKFNENTYFKDKLMAKRVHIILDNATFHYNWNFMNSIFNPNVNLVYGIAYSSFLNPSEYVFKNLKSYLRKLKITNIDELKTETIKCLKDKEMNLLIAV